MKTDSWRHMDDVAAQRIARRIAADLFVNGNPSRDIGGWSDRAVEDRIFLILTGREVTR